MAFTADLVDPGPSEPRSQEAASDIALRCPAITVRTDRRLTLSSCLVQGNLAAFARPLRLGNAMLYHLRPARRRACRP